jgi:hypothetical protein
VLARPHWTGAHAAGLSGRVDVLRTRFLDLAVAARADLGAGVRGRVNSGRRRRSVGVVASRTDARLGPDGLAYAGEQLRGTDTLTLPNGHTFVQEFALNNKDMRVTDNGNGTLTIVGQGVGNFIVSGSHSPLVLRDTGLTRVEVLIDDAGTPTDPF